MSSLLLYLHGETEFGSMWDTCQCIKFSLITSRIKNRSTLSICISFPLFFFQLFQAFTQQLFCFLSSFPCLSQMPVLDPCLLTCWHADGGLSFGIMSTPSAHAIGFHKENFTSSPITWRDKQEFWERSQSCFAVLVKGKFWMCYLKTLYITLSGALGRTC